MATQTQDKDDKWSAEKYNTNASFVYSSKFTTPVLQVFGPKAGETVLDLGCGSGELTLQLAQAMSITSTSGSIVGVDYSADLLRRAAEVLVDQPGITLIHKDGHALKELGEEHQGRYDGVFTSAALHWMKKNPKKVVDGAFGVLKKGGRFAGEFGGYLNMVGVRSALHTVLRAHGYDPEQYDPWYFPTPEAYTRVLESAGFRVESCELVPRITPLPTGLRGWLETFGFSFLDHLSPGEKQQVLDEVCDMCERDLRHEDGWTCMYVRLRFKAWKD